MNAKRTVYLCLATLLGVVASYGVHALAELWYLRWADRSGNAIVWTKHFGVGQCALPWFAQYGLLAAGIVGGYLLGRVWWRMVYVEHRHWMRK